MASLVIYGLLRICRWKESWAGTTTQSGKDAGSVNNGATTGYEAELWRMVDALRGSLYSAEYKHVALGIIFLKYISDAFEEARAKLVSGQRRGVAHLVPFPYVSDAQKPAPTPGLPSGEPFGVPAFAEMTRATVIVTYLTGHCTSNGRGEQT